MKILAHRGCWRTPEEKNSRVAIQRAFDNNFGIETDVRDADGTLVISHDPPLPGREYLALTDLLAIPGAAENTLALNIKSDGLAQLLGATPSLAGKSNWFAFDMSFPDMLPYLSAGMPVLARLSEYEQRQPCHKAAIGYWLDAFHGDWYCEKFLLALLAEGLQVCVVSPELHHRNHHPLWNMLRIVGTQPGLMLCTDFPMQARDFFS